MRQRERGFTICEALAALALIGLVLTCGLSVIFEAKSTAERYALAAERFSIAERLMERTLATERDQRRDRQFAPGDPELGDGVKRRGSIHVESAGPGLQRIEVEVRDAHGRTRLVALNTPWETGR